MIRKLLLFVVLIFLPILTFGQSIWRNDINGNNINSNNTFTNGQIVDPNISVSGISRSGGLSNSNVNDRFNASGWPNTFNLNNYFEFTLTPNLGNAINFISLVYTGQASSSGTNVSNFAVRSSIDNFSTNIGTPVVGGGNISLSGASYQGVTNSITFRIYAWGGSNTRQYSINDFQFNGTVNCVAPPSTTGVVICQGGTGALTASPYTSFVNTFTGSWNSSIDPTARRVQNSMSNSTTCSFDSQTRNYVAHTFTVNTSGAYTFKMSDTGNYDGAAYIYSGAYTPGNCSGSGSDYWRGDDDVDGQAREPRITANLVTGVTYTLISTTFGNTGTVDDSFVWTITPPTSDGGIVLTTPVNWYNASGTLLKTGSSFNPVNVPNSGLTNTNTVGTTVFYAGYVGSCAKTAANFTINGNNSPTTSVGSYTFCIDQNDTQVTGNINAGQYALVDVVQGYKYTFQVGDIFSGLNEKLNILDATTDLDVSPSATNSGATGTSIVDWPATFSGKVKVVVSTGSCSNNGTAGTGGLTLTLKTVGNSLDNQLATGTTDNTWRGHIYNWTSATLPPGGAPSTTSIETTTPFSSTEYAGYYDETSETITQGFGGNDVCFPVLSNGVQRASIRTEQFAVRYRMKSTKSGCYLVKIRTDDGAKLYLDGVLVFQRWAQQSPTTFDNLLINLTGNNNLVLDYYENGGGNIIEFSMTPFNAATNTVATTNPIVVCSGSAPGIIDGSSYQYVGTEVNPTIKFQWESAPSASGPWVNVTTGTGINSEDYTPAAITGNATQNITYYRRTVSAAYNGSCSNSSTPVSITTNAASTLTLTSGTASQTTCSGTAITNIVYTWGGGATDVTVTGLPAGLSFAKNAGAKTVTISGTATATGTYDVTTTGHTTPCTAVSLGGTITMNQASTLLLTSGTASQTLCSGTAITNIVYTWGGSATDVTVTGLPAGLSAAKNAGAKTVTISGTATATGTYSVTTTGHTTPCTAVSLGGTITMNQASTLVLTSGTASQTLCSGTPITNIVYTWGGSATDVTVTGLPAGLSFAKNAGAKTVTISGTATATGTYSVTTTGHTTPCTAVSLGGTITMNQASTLALTSGTASQIICSGTAITGIVYTWGGSATDVTVTGLPAGLSFTKNVGAKTVTISGTATATGTYSVTTTGHTTPCTAVSLGGTITMNQASTLVLTSGTASQTTCSGTAITNIVYTWGGSAADVTVTGLPAGLSTAKNPGAKTVTISGTATATGTYSVTTTGHTSPCTAVSLGGTITTISAPATPTATVTTQPTCANNTGTITVSSPVSGYGYSIDGLDYSNTNGIFPSLAPTTYNVTAKNISTGCISSAASVTINTATSKQWNGLVDTSWSNPANWTPNGVPAQTDCVVIPVTGKQPIIDGVGSNFYAHTVSINSGGVLTVNSNKTLNLTNEVTVNAGGSLIFNNNSSLMQSNKNAVNSGNITYIRETSVRRYDYTYWSSPLTLGSNFTLHSMSPNTLADKYTSYDATGGSWAIHNGGGKTMIPGEGYSVRGPQNFDIVNPGIQTASFIGVPNNGDVLKTTVKDRFNLLGNPYPSAISTTQLITDTNIGTIYFWTHNTPPSNGGSGNKYKYASADYASINLSGPLASGGDPTGPTGFIAAGQGFFAAPTTNSITFTNSMRVGGSNDNFYKTAKTDGLERNRIWLNFTNAEGAFKQMLVGYIEGASNSWDQNYDAVGFNGNTYVDFYSINENTPLSIQGRALPFENSDVIPLGYKTTIAGDFKISIDHVDGLFNSQEVYLEDKKTGVIYDLKAGDYNFKTEIGTFKDRFTLRYTNKTLGTGDFENVKDGLLVSVKDKVIRITSSKENIKDVTVFDITGKLIFNKKKVGSTELSISNLQAADQVLLVKVILENNAEVTRKVIFK